jgi:SNF2 family DNA or RNA helicase
VDEQLLVFDDGSIIDASTSQKLRQALQQVVVNWEHFANDLKCISQAYRVIDQTIEEIEVSNKSKSKLIIWIAYKRTARNITSYCNSLGIKTVAAYAEADTEKSVQDFLEDDSTRILVANPQSCGAGLNPQFVCSEDLYLEISTSPIYMRQALGRIDRMGQTKTPRHKFAIANGTVQVGLLQGLLANDDLVATVETDKRSIRAMLMGEM